MNNLDCKVGNAFKTLGFEPMWNGGTYYFEKVLAKAETASRYDLTTGYSLHLRAEPLAWTPENGDGVWKMELIMGVSILSSCCNQIDSEYDIADLIEEACVEAQKTLEKHMRRIAECQLTKS